jgi:hypothetical protein
LRQGSHHSWQVGTLDRNGDAQAAANPTGHAITHAVTRRRTARERWGTVADSAEPLRLFYANTVLFWRGMGKQFCVRIVDAGALSIFGRFRFQPPTIRRRNRFDRLSME